MILRFYIRALSSEFIVVVIDQVHGMHQLVGENKWSHQNQTAQNTPNPEILRTEPKLTLPKFQLLSHSITELVHPDEQKHR